MLFYFRFVVFAKRTETNEARIRLFCMTDDREDKTLEHKEQFTEVSNSRDVEVRFNNIQPDNKRVGLCAQKILIRI